MFDSAKASRFIEAVRKTVTSCSEPLADSAEARAIAHDLVTLYMSTGKGAPGETCKTQNDCAPIAGATSICAAARSGASDELRCFVYRPAKEGLACDDATTFDLGNCAFDDFTGTGDGFYCGPTDGRCHARGARGVACGDATQPECALGSRCLDGKCAALGRANEACAEAGDCDVGLACTAGTCTARKQGGAACTTPDECASSRCSLGRCAAISLATAAVCSGHAE